MVRKELEDRYGYEGLYHRGLRVTTTLLPDASGPWKRPWRAT